MKRKTLFFIFISITVLWLAFIFANSFDDGVRSGEKSKLVTSAINSTLHSLGFEFSVPEGFVRTLAHFGEFAILSALLCIDITLYFNKNHYAFVFSVPTCFVFAAIDETIQKFSAGRAMQFLDVLVDTAGALCAAIAFFLIRYLIIRIKNKKKA